MLASRVVDRGFEPRSLKFYREKSMLASRVVDRGFEPRSLKFYREKSMLISRVVDRGFEPRSGQSKDYNIGICFFSSKHTLRRKREGWLAQNQDNVSNWSYKSICRQLFE